TNKGYSVQLRGEYVYMADGKGGLRILDVAQIDQKGFSDRIATSPVSPLDQRLRVKTKDARWVASPTTMGVDPTRAKFAENQEQKIHPLYAYLYVADKQEGLILVLAATLLDGDPRNNVLEKSVTFNPNGILKGADYVKVAGRFVYVGCDRGLVVVDVNDPAKPEVAAVYEGLKDVRGVEVQFRWIFIACDHGLISADVTPEPDGSFKKDAKLGSKIPLRDARGVYVAKTYAYVAAGRDGIVIVDITKPDAMKKVQRFTADGRIRDANDIQLGITNASLFAYVADGRNGLRVVQLTAPERNPTLFGWSPKPDPQLIATARTQGSALSLSRGLDRDRAVDEAGNQLAVFNRLGARPFTFAEMQRFYRLPGGSVFTVPEIRNADDVRRHYGEPGLQAPGADGR
ncbi:MAG: LVIVD repeat-containing protein, partial [Planctomycetota bacterium]